MVETGRYRVNDYRVYDEQCTASIGDVDIVYVEEVDGDEVHLEEVNNKRGEGASNTVDRSTFAGLIEGGYVEEANY